MGLEAAVTTKRPNAARTDTADGGGGDGESSQLCCWAPAPEVSRLTVWCKSLVFHGDGYVVYDDADGRMVYRVDNYDDGRGSMALMDHAGRVLLTVRRRHRKMLCLAETWEVYKGDVDDETSGGHDEPHLMMRATKALCNSTCTVSVLAVTTAGDEPVLYHMSWSRREEWSRIHRSGPADGSLVAEVRRKRGGPKKATLLGKDVLSLVVQPKMDQTVAMAMLMISNSYR